MNRLILPTVQTILNTNMQNQWEITDGKMVKHFEFKNFVDCVRFIQQIAPLAENLNHHPDILIHSYKKVKITLYTHSQNKITELDYLLAQQIDKL